MTFRTLAQAGSSLQETTLGKGTECDELLALFCWRWDAIRATLIETDRWTLAEELWSFGEDSLYPVAFQLSDEDMVRLWLVAGGLLLKERARSSGEATALAAVTVIEGNHRPLARKRRRPQANRLRFEQTPEERYAEISRIEDSPSFDEEWR